MEPKKQHISAFTVAGITVRTINTDEMNPAQAKLPGHWGRFFLDNLAEKIPHRLPGTPVYGVYANYESDYMGHFDLTAGVAVASPPKDTAFTPIEVREGDYLVFESRGPMPQAVIAAWQAVWLYFQTHPEIRRAYATDFEAYTGADAVAVYIGVNEK